MDAQTVKRLALILAEQRDAIIERWTVRVRDTLRGRLGKSELSRQIEELYGAVYSALESGGADIDAPQAAEVLTILTELSRSRARQGFSATETACRVFALKDALYESLPEPVRAGPGRLRGLRALRRPARAVHLRKLRQRAATRIITEQAEQLLELSTPVVKLWDGVVAVPLVGTLDSARAQVVMERLLQTLVDTGSPYAIIDITGVPAVDTQVAQHILKTVVAARLMGAECIISGIRPQIAQTIVALGIEFGDIATKATPGRRAAARPARDRRRAGPTHQPAGAEAVMDRVPILKIGDVLLVSIQVDMEDQTRAARCRRTWPSASSPPARTACIIDITALDIVDSFVGRMLATIAVDVAGARRRDRGRRHAAGGGDHAGRARAARCAASGPRSTWSWA